jgi:hypothetical protein
MGNGVQSVLMSSIVFSLVEVEGRGWLSWSELCRCAEVFFETAGVDFPLFHLHHLSLYRTRCR